MEGLDSSAIAPALPQMAAAFGTDPVALSVGISAYLVAVAMFVPTSRWAAETFGVRNVFCCAVLVFVFASVLCGQSTSLPEFAAARVLQGIGGAMMSPVGRMEVIRSTPKDGLMRAMSILAWPGLIGFMIGPVVGGFLTTYASWRWIFFMNIPIGAVGIVAVYRFFGNAPAPRRPPFDALGFVLNGSALVLLIGGFDILGHYATIWPLGLAMTAAGGGLCVLAVLHAMRHQHPLVSLAPARFKTFSAATLTGGLPLRITVGATVFLLPLTFQVGLGLSPEMTALMLLALAIGDIGMKAFTTRIGRSFGFRNTMLWTNVVAVAISLIYAVFVSGTPLWLMAFVTFLGGAVRSVQFTTMNSLTFADIPQANIGDASTLYAMMHQTAMALGVATVAVVVNLSAQRHGGVSTLGDFSVAFCALAVVGLVATWSFFRLAPDAGVNVSGYRSKR